MMTRSEPKIVNDVVLRLAADSDVPAINDIYNYYVRTSTCTYQLEPDPLEARRAWLCEHVPELYPAVVAESDGDVLGWGSLSPFRPRAGYAPTTEASVYIRHDKHRQGLGKMILTDLIQRARTLGFHSLIGGVSADQTASLSLQESLGFKRVAHFVEVGLKFGRRLDLIYLQLMLDPDPGHS